jgi:hypothetical protein
MHDRWDASLRAATRPDQALTEAGAHLS